MKEAKALQTIMVLALALALAYWFTQNNWLLLAAGILLATGILWPAATVYIHWLWMKLAEVLNWITSKIILSAVFFIVLLPLGLLSKIARKKKRNAGQGFKERNFTYTKESLENTW